MGLNSVRITPDNETKLKENCKQRGDKSKIINLALENYFLPKEAKKTSKPEVKFIA